MIGSVCRWRATRAIRLYAERATLSMSRTGNVFRVIPRAGQAHHHPRGSTVTAKMRSWRPWVLIKHEFVRSDIYLIRISKIVFLRFLLFFFLFFSTRLHAASHGKIEFGHTQNDFALLQPAFSSRYIFILNFLLKLLVTRMYHPKSYYMCQPACSLVEKKRKRKEENEENNFGNPY